MITCIPCQLRLQFVLLDIACYLLDRFYNKRHCLTYREKTTEEKRKNTFDEDEEDVDYENENTISRSSSIR